MKLIKIDKKTGKKYIINVPEWEVPVVQINELPNNSMGMNLAISSNSGSVAN